MTYLRSDVYYVEQDLSHTAAAVATSIGAVVGASTKGPLGLNRVTSADEYVRTYGEPSAYVSFMGHTATAFLSQATELWVNRVVGKNATWGCLMLQQTPEGSALTEFVANSNPQKDGFDMENEAGASKDVLNIAAFYPVGPGGYSRDLSIELKSDNLSSPLNLAAYDFSTVGVIVAGVDASANLPAGTYEYAVAAVNTVGETPASEFKPLKLPGGVAAFLTWAAKASATGYKVYRKTADGQWGLLATLGRSATTFIDKGLEQPDVNSRPKSVGATTNIFFLNFYDNAISKNHPAESYEVTLRDFTSGMGVQLELEQRINGVSKLFRVQSNVGAFEEEPAVFSVGRTNCPAGSSGDAVTATDVANGWDAFRNKEEVDVRLLLNAGYSTPAVQIKMNEVARYRQDCVALLDVPPNKQDADAAIDYRNIDLNINSKRCALYASDVLVQDPYTGKRLFVPPSGYVGAVYAYTDASTYPWRAPAGPRRGLLDVLGVRHKYDAGDRDALAASQVNYIRDIKGMGRAVWEQKTLQSVQSGYSYMNVVRMMDYVALSLYKVVVGSSLQEPNDEVLWASLKLLAEEVIEPVKRARGIKEYTVICDRRNNPVHAENRGEVYLDYIIIPTIPAEKIILRSTLSKAGVSVEELANSGAVF